MWKAVSTKTYLSKCKRIESTLSRFERNQSFQWMSIFQNEWLVKNFFITGICYRGYFLKKSLKYFLEGYIFEGNKYMLKVNNRSTKRTCERICSKLIKNTPEKHQGCRSCVYLPLPLNTSHTFF